MTYLLLVGGLFGLSVAGYSYYRSVQSRTADPLGDYNVRRLRNKRRHKAAIMTEVRKHGRITRAAATYLVGVSPATATRYLQELKDEGKLREKGHGRGYHYIRR